MSGEREQRTQMYTAKAADVRRDEVENTVHAVVRDVLAVQAALVLEVLLVRAVDVLLDGAPAETIGNGKLVLKIFKS